MKKLITTIIFISFFITGAFSQNDTSLLNVKKYELLFGTNQRDISRQYVDVAPDDDYERFSNLDGNLTDTDTPLEFALLSYYSQPVLNIRPPEANAMLPTNNPRIADQKLGAAVFQEIQLRFLGDSAAVSRHETVLQWIIDRGNVTRAEVETFYRNGIRGLITEIVDEEFNKVSFALYGHNAVLTRNPQNGHYTLSYGGVNTNNETRVVTASSLEALSSVMRNGANRADFTPADLNTVRAQAQLIPAVVLSNTALTEITNILTRFYTEPNHSTYTAVLDAYRVIDQALLNTRNTKYAHVSTSYQRMLSVLNRDFAQKVFVDERTLRSVTILTRDQQQRLVQLR